jgi:hypothetical protein
MYIRQFVPVTCTCTSKWCASLSMRASFYLESRLVVRQFEHACQFLPGVQVSGAPV